MAVRKLPSGNYQARLAGPDGRVLSQALPTRLEAEEQVLRWKREKREGQLKGRSARHTTVEDMFRRWYADQGATREKSGWLKARQQHYRDYIHPLLGNQRLSDVRPHMVQAVLTAVGRRGLSAQTQRHVFNLMRKLFGDAICPAFLLIGLLTQSHSRMATA
jgi:hypothetical protein